MRYIYLIQSLEDGHYKIGVSKHPQKRLKQLQTGNSSELKIIETFQTEIPFQVEKTLQRRYSHFHKEGEWFDMSITQEVEFLKECKRIEQNIIVLKENGNVFI